MGRRQPPDLPSMLLSARVVYLGMPVSLSDAASCSANLGCRQVVQCRLPSQRVLGLLV